MIHVADPPSSITLLYILLGAVAKDMFMPAVSFMKERGCEGFEKETKVN